MVEEEWTLGQVMFFAGRIGARYERQAAAMKGEKGEEGNLKGEGFGGLDPAFLSG